MRNTTPAPTPHPTLRRADLFPGRANDPRALCGSDALHLTYNARGAFYQLLQALPEKAGTVVLLPAFHCTALVEPVAHSRFRAIFYRIKPDLSIDLDDLRSKLTPDVALVAVIHFFGFPTDLNPVLSLAEQTGSYVLEDCAHSFLTLTNGHAIGDRGDFSIYSYYKTIPSLLGGALRINRNELNFMLSKKSIPAKESAIITKRLLEQLLDNSGDGLLKHSLQTLEKFRVARRRQKTAASGAGQSAFVDDPYLFREDLAIAKIPMLCERIVNSSDWQGTVSARRRNYELLNAALEENPLLQKLCPALPKGVCPWAFPVLLRDRARFEHQLRDRGVPLFTFGETLHPLLQSTDNAARSDAEDLSQRLLALPVHQNLSAEDVAHYAQVINGFFAGATLPLAGGAPELARQHVVGTRS
jgi:perosamine synthetase